MFSPNPHTAYYALLSLESIVKNCGPPIHEEVSTKASCEMFTNLISTSQHENVKNKMLELIQVSYQDDFKTSRNQAMNFYFYRFGHTLFVTTTNIEPLRTR